MNVRVDWQSSGAEPSRRSPSEPGGSAGKRRSKDVKLFGVLGIGVLAVIIAAVTVGGNKSTQDGRKQKGPSPSASGSASTSVDAGGMLRGTASAAGLDGTRRIAGQPRGFPHTTDGAVEAAATAMAASYTMERMTPADRSAWVKDVFLKVPTDTEDKAKLYQSQNNLNTQGQLIDPATGQPASDRRFTSLCHPELGAYKVESSSEDAVTVDVWQVCITGVIAPETPSNVNVNWMIARGAMVWSGSDWRVAGVGQGSFNTAPAPADKAQPATTYPERAKILAAYGAGWMAYADGSDKVPAEMGTAQ